MIITKLWIVVISRGEGENCDWEETLAGMLEGTDDFYFLSLAFVYNHSLNNKYIHVLCILIHV